MELLFEEVFKKIFRMKKNSMALTMIINFLMYLIIIVIVVLIIFAIITGKFYLIAFIFGLIFLAEVAHFIRKHRERKFVQRNEYKYGVRDAIRGGNRNKNLLKVDKTRNKGLIK